MISDAEVFGHPALVVELEWLTLARQVVERAGALRLYDSLLDYALKKCPGHTGDIVTIARVAFKRNVFFLQLLFIAGSLPVTKTGATSSSGGRTLGKRK